MTNDEFKSLVEKCLQGNHLIQVMITDSRCAVSRIPSAFGKTLAEIIPVLAKNLALFCDPSAQFVRVFNLQPTAMLPPNSTQIASDYWCSLEMDICRRNDHGVVRTKALYINFSNGQIVNEAAFLNLFWLQSTDGTSPAILGKISSEVIFLAWSELRRKCYTQELSANDKSVAEVYNNPLCVQNNYLNLADLPSMYYLSMLRLSMFRAASIVAEAQQNQLAPKEAADNTFIFYRPL